METNRTAQRIKGCAKRKGRTPKMFFPAESWAVLSALSAIVLRYAPGPIVEIGTSRGEYWTSTGVLAERAEEFNVEFITCDNWKNPILIDYEKHTHFNCKSDEFMNLFNKEPSVVMLDGCHDYEVVALEISFFLGLLHPKGIIFMHDTFPPSERHLERGHCSDSYKVRQELERRKDVWTYTWPYTAGSNGLTMVSNKITRRGREIPYFQR